MHNRAQFVIFDPHRRILGSLKCGHPMTEAGFYKSVSCWKGQARGIFMMLYTRKDSPVLGYFIS